MIRSREIMKIEYCLNVLRKGGFMKVLCTVVLLSSMLFGQILYEEHFTGGAMQLD